MPFVIVNVANSQFFVDFHDVPQGASWSDVEDHHVNRFESVLSAYPAMERLATMGFMCRVIPEYDKQVMDADKPFMVRDVYSGGGGVHHFYMVMATDENDAAAKVERRAEVKGQLIVNALEEEFKQGPVVRFHLSQPCDWLGGIPDQPPTKKPQGKYETMGYEIDHSNEVGGSAELEALGVTLGIDGIDYSTWQEYGFDLDQAMSKTFKTRNELMKYLSNADIVMTHDTLSEAAAKLAKHFKFKSVPSLESPARVYRKKSDTALGSTKK